MIRRAAFEVNKRYGRHFYPFLKVVKPCYVRLYGCIMLFAFFIFFPCFWNRHELRELRSAAQIYFLPLSNRILSAIPFLSCDLHCHYQKTNERIINFNKSFHHSLLQTHFIHIHLNSYLFLIKKLF